MLLDYYFNDLKYGVENYYRSLNSLISSDPDHLSLEKIKEVSQLNTKYLKKISIIFYKALGINPPDNFVCCFAIAVLSSVIYLIPRFFNHDHYLYGHVLLAGFVVSSFYFYKSVRKGEFSTTPLLFDDKLNEKIKNASKFLNNIQDDNRILRNSLENYSKIEDLNQKNKNLSYLQKTCTTILRQTKDNYTTFYEEMLNLKKTPYIETTLHT